MFLAHGRNPFILYTNTITSRGLNSDLKFWSFYYCILLSLLGVCRLVACVVEGYWKKQKHCTVIMYLDVSGVDWLDLHSVIVRVNKVSCDLSDAIFGTGNLISMYWHDDFFDDLTVKCVLHGLPHEKVHLKNLFFLCV